MEANVLQINLMKFGDINTHESSSACFSSISSAAFMSVLFSLSVAHTYRPHPQWHAPAAQ